MDVIQELYNAHAHSLETEKTLLELDKELMKYIESNVASTEKAIFLATLESIMKSREQYFFQLGFNTAKNLLLK